MIFDPSNRKKKKKRPGFDDIMPQPGDPRDPEASGDDVSKPPGVLDEPLDMDGIKPSVKKKTRKLDDEWTEW